MSINPFLKEKITFVVRLTRGKTAAAIASFIIIIQHFSIPKLKLHPVPNLATALAKPTPSHHDPERPHFAYFSNLLFNVLMSASVVYIREMFVICFTQLFLNGGNHCIEIVLFGLENTISESMHAICQNPLLSTRGAGGGLIYHLHLSLALKLLKQNLEITNFHDSRQRGGNSRFF
jgi:hypothetical protein